MTAMPLGPALVAVFIGAGLGACLRYALGETLNHLLPRLPLGTLAANLIGGYLVGIAIGFFAWRSDLSVLWRLALITGFLGGLTTFSSYSVESLVLIQRGHWALAAGHTLAHVLGALACAALGYRLGQALLT